MRVRKKSDQINWVLSKAKHIFMEVKYTLLYESKIKGKHPNQVRTLLTGPRRNPVNLTSSFIEEDFLTLLSVTYIMYLL